MCFMDCGVLIGSLLCKDIQPMHPSYHDRQLVSSLRILEHTWWGGEPIRTISGVRSTLTSQLPIPQPLALGRLVSCLCELEGRVDLTHYRPPIPSAATVTGRGRGFVSEASRGSVTVYSSYSNWTLRPCIKMRGLLDVVVIYKKECDVTG